MLTIDELQGILEEEFKLAEDYFPDDDLQRDGYKQGIQYVLGIIEEYRSK